MTKLKQHAVTTGTDSEGFYCEISSCSISTATDSQSSERLLQKLSVTRIFIIITFFVSY